jgi:hypothetical protein
MQMHSNIPNDIKYMSLRLCEINLHNLSSIFRFKPRHVDSDALKDKFQILYGDISNSMPFWTTKL